MAIASLGIIFSQTTVPYGGGLQSTVKGEVIAGVILAIATAIVTWIVNRVRNDHKLRDAEIDKKFSDIDVKITNQNFEINQKLAKQEEILDEMLMVWKTAPVTSTNPQPQPGLVDRLVGRGGLFDVVQERGIQQEKIVELLEQHGAVLDSLDKDRKNNGGSSTRDAIDDIRRMVKGDNPQ